MIHHPPCRVLTLPTCMVPAQRLALTTVGVRDDLAAAPIAAHRQRDALRGRIAHRRTAVIHCACPWGGFSLTATAVCGRNRRWGPASASLSAAHQARTAVSNSSAWAAVAVGSEHDAGDDLRRCRCSSQRRCWCGLPGLQVAKPATCRKHDGERNFWRTGVSHRRIVGSRRASRSCCGADSGRTPGRVETGRGAAARGFTAALLGTRLNQFFKTSGYRDYRRTPGGYDAL